MLKENTKSHMNVDHPNLFLQCFCFVIFGCFFFFLTNMYFQLVIFMEILPYLISCFIFQK